MKIGVTATCSIRNDTYTLRGAFDPEETMRVFSEAIEQALSDGFNFFRAAAEMSWALDVADGAEAVITYEALLRMLFANSPATGLCLYDKRRMPLQILNGALLTHPIVESAGGFTSNGAYDAHVRVLADVDETLVGHVQGVPDILTSTPPTPRPPMMALAFRDVDIQ